MGNKPKQRADAMLDFLLLAPAVLPLLYVPALFYPFVTPKTLVFRALAIIAVAALGSQVLGGRALHFSRLKQKITWIPAALVVVMYVTSLAGIDFRHSFWSTFERGDGLLSATAAVLLFYAILLHADAGFLRRLAVATMWVANAVALIACLQWWPLHDRVGSTLGNAAHMSSLLGMAVFLSLWQLRSLRGLWRGVAALGIALQLLAIIVLSSTRGTIVALGVAALLAALFAAWKLQGRTRLAARVFLVCVIMGAGLFLAFRTQLAAVPFAPLQRLATMSPSSDTGAVRMYLWERLGREGLRRPIAGYGSEHIDSVFDKVYEPYRTGEWTDRSHNAVMDYFVQYGIGGALLYVALIAAALRAAWLIFRSGNVAGGYVVLLLVTYTVQNLFVFDTALSLWLLLAVFAAVVAAQGAAPERLRMPALPAAARLAPWILLALLIPAVVQPARANLLLAKAVASGVSDVGAATRALQKGLALDTYADLEYGYTAYQIFATAQAPRLSGESRLRAYRTAVDILSRNFERYPYDARTAVFLAHLIDLTPVEAAPDLTLLGRAIDRAMRLSPGRADPWDFKANIEIRQADAELNVTLRNAKYLKAITILSEYAGMHPERPDTRYAIAGLYLAVGDAGQAQVWADAGDAAYARHSDASSASRAARYYLRSDQWARSRRFLERVVEDNPQDYATLLNLAKVQWLAGNGAQARDIIARLRRESPGILAGETQFVAQVEAAN